MADNKVSDNQPLLDTIVQLGVAAQRARDEVDEARMVQPVFVVSVTRREWNEVERCLTRLFCKGRIFCQPMCWLAIVLILFFIAFFTVISRVALR